MKMKKFLKRVLSAVIIAASLPVGSIYAADPGLENVALNKTVYSSGNFSAAWYDVYAVDGDLNKGYASSNNIPADRPLQLSEGEESGIMIDLEEVCLVSEIDVRTRRDMDQPYSRRGWKVYVADNIEFNNAELVGTKMIAGAFGEDLEIKFSTAKRIRYIKVVSSAGMVISEIEAWGIALGDGTGFADYSDMEATNASYLLSYLGIIKNSSVYEPLKLVTRKEAAEYMLKLKNDNSESDKVYFQDVPAEHNYAKIIGACCESGIITQAENFRPDDFVSEYEFLVMVLRILGYNNALGVDFRNPMSVKQKAYDLKLLKNTNFQTSEYVNRENAMWIMYNALNTGVWAASVNGSQFEYKEREYLLEKAFNLILKKGVITANNETSLIDAAAKADDYIAVDNTDYQDESGILYRNIGERVVYFVDKDDESVIKFGFADFERNTVTTLYCDDLTDVDKNYISYDSNGVTKRYKLDEAKILKNHAAYTDYRMETTYFDVPDGYLELTDNDGDGAYEVIDILEPTVIEVERISFSDGMNIIAKGGKRYTFDEYDNLDITINGRRASEKNFANSKIVLLYAANGRKNIYADGYASSVTGTVESKKDDTVRIDGEEFLLSDYFTTEKNPDSALILGETVTAYYIGNKIYSTDKNALNNAETIGFILKARPDENEETFNFRIYTVNGAFVDLTIRSKVKVDGISWDFARISENRDYFEKKFAKFKANAQNELTWIDTENYTSANEPKSDMKKIEEVTSACRKNVDGIWSGFTMAAAVKEDAPMFMIPMTNGQYETDREYEMYYSISRFSRVYTYNGQTIDKYSSFYNKDSEGYATFGVAAKNVPIISGSYVPCSKADSPIFVYSSMAQGLNDDDETVGIISGYDITTGNSVSYTMPSGMIYAVNTPQIVADKASGLYSTSSYMAQRDVDIPDKYLYPVDSLKPGSVLRAETDGQQIIGLDLLSDGDWEQTLNYTCLNGLDSIYSGYLIMNITLEKIADNVLTYNTGYGSAVKNYNEFQTMIVVEGKNVSRVSKTELPRYFGHGKNAFVLFKAGRAVGIVLKGNER